MKFRKNSSARSEIVYCWLSRDVRAASCDKRNVSSTDTNCSHSELPAAPSALCGSLPAPFCACPANLASAIISSIYCPTRPLRVMNALLCLPELLFFNASVCRPEYIVQLGLLRDSTGVKRNVWAMAAPSAMLRLLVCQFCVEQVK